MRGTVTLLMILWAPWPDGREFMARGRTPLCKFGTVPSGCARRNCIATGLLVAHDPMPHATGGGAACWHANIWAGACGLEMGQRRDGHLWEGSRPPPTMEPIHANDDILQAPPGRRVAIFGGGSDGLR